MRQKFKISHFMQALRMAGTPGLLLIGYYVVQIVFARQKADMSAVDGSAMIFAAYALASGAYSFQLLRKRGFNSLFFQYLMKHSPIKWFIAYSVMCLLSALWSPMFALSAYRAVECIGFTFLNASVIMTLLRNTDSRGVVQWSALYAFVNVMLTFVSTYMNDGIDQALFACQFPSTIFFYMAFYYAPSWWTKWPVMIVAFACKSVTGYVGMCLGMCSLMFGKAKYRMLGIGIAVAIGFAASTMGVDNLLNSTIFASKGGVIENGQISDDKTSGRSEIWEMSLAEMKSQGKQLYGLGFVAGETQFVHQLIGDQVIGMHNGFMSAYVGTGVIGFVLFTLFMIGVVLMPFGKKISKDFKPVLLASMFVILVHTFGNPGLGFRVYGTWLPAMYIVTLTIGFRFKSHHQNMFLDKI